MSESVFCLFPANSVPEPLSSPNPKPELAAHRPLSRDEPAAGGYLPLRGLTDKPPVNGTDAPPSKPLTAPTSYNRYVPKPYTSAARPFERKFESPKFNHNLLLNDAQAKTDLLGKPGAPCNSGGKPQLSPQPPDHDSGLDTFTRTMDNRPKYQHNNVNAVPKAVPVRYSCLCCSRAHWPLLLGVRKITPLLSPLSPSTLDDDDDEDEGHTVVATARGIFNCNGGVLSSIETGVSIIIPQGAIPESVEQEIYFKVCRDNNILPPLDKEKGWSHHLFYHGCLYFYDAATLRRTQWLK